MPMPKLSKGYSERGADMGRRDRKADNDDQRFWLQKMVMSDYGCYDAGGAYWGNGAAGGQDWRTCPQMYRYLSEDGEGEGFFRAKNRAEAKDKVREVYPKARFFN